MIMMNETEKLGRKRIREAIKKGIGIEIADLADELAGDNNLSEYEELQGSLWVYYYCYSNEHRYEPTGKPE